MVTKPLWVSIRYVQADTHEEAIKRVQDGWFEENLLFADEVLPAKRVKVKLAKTPEQKAANKTIKSARHYLLCDSDLTIEEQVEAISKHPDPTDYIDNVEGVSVWERVEWKLRCAEFLNLIGY